MKKFIFDEEFVNTFAIDDSNIKWIKSDIDITKEINYPNADIDALLDIIFDQFYYVQSHYLRDKRTSIVTFLLKNKTLFETTRNYEKFLVIIFIHLVILNTQKDNIIERLITYLSDFYGENLWANCPDFTRNCFLQYTGAYYHRHHRNTEAKKMLEFTGNQTHTENNTDFITTNLFLLTTVYITCGKHRDAIIVCQKASSGALATGNFIRYFYCEMNRAGICSAMGDFQDSINIYTECLNGSETIAPKEKNYLIENIANNYMYLQEYKKAIYTIERIKSDEINMNAAYICALSYFELGNKTKAQEWMEIGHHALYAHKTAEMFITLLEKLLANNDEDIIDYLKQIHNYEKTTEDYATYSYVTRRLIRQLAKLSYYEEAYQYAEDFFKL